MWTESQLSAWLQLGFASIALLGVIFGFINRTHQYLGVGKRYIQYIAVVILLPIILILAMQGIIEKQLLGGLLGAIIGYTLSDLAKDSEEEKGGKKN